MANQNDSSLGATCVDDEVFFGHVGKREQRIREKFEAGLSKYSNSYVPRNDAVKNIPVSLSLADNENKPNDNDSLCKSFSIDVSKCERFDDSLDGGLLENQKEVFPNYLSDQLNDNYRVSTERRRLKNKAFYDSLEDICSLASIAERCSISGESEKVVNVLEQQLISEDSLKNSPSVLVENKSSSINENIHFDDDSLAILEFEKTFDDSLEEFNLPPSFDVEKITTAESNCLGNPDADELKAERSPRPRNLFETSVEIIYEKLESLAYVSKENYMTDINKLSHDSLSNSDCNEAFKDSLEDNHEQFNILSCQGQNASENKKEIKVMEENEFALPCSNEANVFEKSNGQKIVEKEFLCKTSMENEMDGDNSIIKKNFVFKSSEENMKGEESKVGEGNKLSNYKSTAENKLREEKDSDIMLKSKFHVINSVETNLCTNDKADKAAVRSKICKVKSADENIHGDKNDRKIVLKNQFHKLETVDENVHKKGRETEVFEGTQEFLSITSNTKLPKKHRRSKSVKGNKSAEKKLREKDKTKVVTKHQDLSSITFDQNVHDEGKEKELVKEKNLSSGEADMLLAQKSEASVIHLARNSQNQLEKNAAFSEISKDGNTENFIGNETEQNSYAVMNKNNFSDEIKMPTDFNIKLHIELTVDDGGCKVASKNVKLIPSSSSPKSRIDMGVFDKKPQKLVVNKMFGPQTQGLNNCESSTISEKKAIAKTYEEVIRQMGFVKSESSNKIKSRRISVGIHTEFNNDNSVLLQALDLHDTSINFRSDSSIQSRDSIMPLNLCLRDTSFFKKHTLVHQSESKENIPEHVQYHSDMKQYHSHPIKSVHKNNNVETPKDPNHFENTKRNLRKPIFTKIPVRKVENFATPYATPKRVTKEYKPVSSEKVKFTLSKEPIFHTTPVQKVSSSTSKKTHYCRTSSSSRLPKSAKMVSSKKFQNIESPVAKYIREMRAGSPLRTLKPFGALLNCLTNEVNHPVMEAYGHSPYLLKNISAEKVTKRDVSTQLARH